MKSLPTMAMSLLVLLTCLLCPRLTAAQSQKYLVKDGQPQAEIVLSQTAAGMTQLAARELQAMIQKISGATLPIVHQPTGQGKIAIYVGPSSHTQSLGLNVADLDYDAYLMQSGDDWLALLGRDDVYTPAKPGPRTKEDVPRALDEFEKITGLKVSRLPNSREHIQRFNAELNISEHDGRGTVNAVYAFLHDLGFRWYFPEKYGQVIPKLSTIALPQVKRTIRPAFGLRMFDQYYTRFGEAQCDIETELKWQLSLGINSGYEVRGVGPMGHGLSSITNGKYLYKEGPERDAFHASLPVEMFALYDGQRHVGDNQCLSSPELFRRTVAYAKAVFDLYDVRVLDISPDDGFGRMCECELCQGKNKPELGSSGAMSDHVWGFINRVAIELYKTHPDHYVCGLAYTAYQDPPTSIDQFSPNVAVMIAQWRTWQLEHMNPKQVQALREAWLTKLPSKKLMLWDYQLHAGRNARVGIPVVYPHLIASDLKSLKGKSQGEFVETFRNYDGWKRNWHALATNHLNMIVTARCWWDPDLDVDALLEEYYSLYYGPASAPMRAFFQFAETNWRQVSKDPAVIDQLLKHLDEAKALAGDGDYAKRVQVIQQFSTPLMKLREVLTSGRENNPEWKIRRRDATNVVIDGKLDEELWQFSPQQTRLLESGGIPKNKTFLYVTWAGNDLYVGMICRDEDMANLAIPTDKNNDTNIWYGDSVELLLETQDHSYYQFVINPAGALLQTSRPGKPGGWTSQIQYAVHKADNGWSVEMRIPAAGAGHAELFPNEGVSGSAPNINSPWFFNLCRMRVRDGETELSAFSPTGKARFQDRNKFAKLYLRK